MIAVLPGRENSNQWRLVSRTGRGADVLATADGDRARRRGAGAWRRAVERLRDGDGELHVLASPDGHYQWVLAGPRGTTIARSPAVYRDAEGCRRAFLDARAAAGTALGGSPRPAPAPRRPQCDDRRADPAVDDRPEH